jgi:hypothetical protein
MGALMPSQADLALQALGHGAAQSSGSQADAALAALAGQAPTGQQDQTAWEKYGGETGRQLGLTLRHAATGISGIPALVGDGLNTAINLGIGGVNSVAGTSIPKLQMPSQVIQADLSAAGLPAPRTTGERIVGGATSAMAGVGPFSAAGSLAQKSVDPLVRAIGSALKSAPGAQLASAAGAGTAGQGAAEAGANPYLSMLAAVLGGGAGGLGGYGASKVVKAAGREFFPSALEAVAPGSVPTAAPKAAAPAVEATAGSSPLPPSPAAAATLAQRTAANLTKAPGANPQAAARAADFGSLGMEGTLGQVSRDPALFAQEQNLRGTPTGSPLLYKFNGQNKQLGNALESVGGSGGTDYQAGKVIMPALQDLDNSMRQQVSAAYKAAEQSSGKSLNVPLQGVAQDYAAVMHNFGDKVPSGVRNNFEALGLTSGSQKKVFTIDDAENLLKNLNANRTTDPATNLALDRLNQSVKQAILSADDQGGVFAGPRSMAKQRFDLHDQIPALADAANNPLNSAGYSSSMPFEKFAHTHVVNGNVDTVGALAQLLKQSAPAAFDELKGQIGNKLQSSAFGVNMAGDKVFRPEMYGKALKEQLGPDLLGRVYSPQELDDLFTIGRVGSYVNAHPAFAPVNTSNSGSAIVSLLSQVPAIGKHIGSAAERAMVAKLLRGDLGDTVNMGTVQPPAGAVPAMNLVNSTASKRQN